MSHWLYSFTGSNPVVLIVTFGTLWAFGEIGITPPAIGRRKRDRNLQGPAAFSRRFFWLCFHVETAEKSGAWRHAAAT